MYTPRNEMETMLFRAYIKFLNHEIRDLDSQMTLDDLMQDIEHLSAYDLNETGYSLATQINFIYDETEVTLIAFFSHVDHFEPTRGVYLTTLFVLADSDQPRVAYNIVPIPRISF